jgi:hypothetical protein
MNGLATAAAAAVSLAAVGYLAATDSKRRRAFRLPPVGRRYAGAAWALALSPGALLPFASGAGGFCVWLGAVAVGGWAIAATPPGRTPGRQAVAVAAEFLRARVAPVAAARWAALRRALSTAAIRRRPGPADRLTTLERRVGQLEAELAAVRGAAAAGRVGSVVELARPAARR